MLRQKSLLNDSGRLGTIANDWETIAGRQNQVAPNCVIALVTKTTGRRDARVESRSLANPRQVRDFAKGTAYFKIGKDHSQFAHSAD